MDGNGAACLRPKSPPPFLTIRNFYIMANKILATAKEN